MKFARQNSVSVAAKPKYSQRLKRRSVLNSRFLPGLKANVKIDVVFGRRGKRNPLDVVDMCEKTDNGFLLPDKKYLFVERYARCDFEEFLSP